MTPSTDAVQLINQGKTKQVWRVEAGIVRLRSKSDITAGDGTRHDVMEGKDRWATATTCNVFKLLDRVGVPSHFMTRDADADTCFIAREVAMIPVEVVARRLAFGSYLERHPDVKPRTRFDSVVVEFFEKDDDNHDPLLTEIYDGTGPVVFRRNPHQPLNHPESNLGLYPPEETKLLLEHQNNLRLRVLEIFEALEEAWAKLGHVLVDLKVEFGFDVETGELLLADVIDNDSWRVWLGGDPEQMVDKQVYRDHGLDEPATAQRIKGNYALVAKLTEAF